MKREEVRQLLNDQASRLFDDIVNSRVLGANNHIRMIGEIMLLTAEDESENGKSVLYKVRETARFFMETRGQQSRAVYHAIQYYIKGLDELENCGEEEIRARITERIGAYGVDAAKDMDTLAFIYRRTWIPS
jgi:ribose 1,5-bisphosphate isomerase